MVSFTISGSDEEVSAVGPSTDVVDAAAATVEHQTFRPKAYRTGLIGFRGFQLQKILDPEASANYGERVHKDALAKHRGNGRGIRAPAGAMQRATLQTAAGRALLDMQQKPVMNIMNQLAQKFGLAVRSKEFNNKPEWRAQPLMDTSSIKALSLANRAAADAPEPKRMRVAEASDEERENREAEESPADTDPTSVLFPEQCGGASRPQFEPYQLTPSRGEAVAVGGSC